MNREDWHYILTHLHIVLTICAVGWVFLVILLSMGAQAS